MHLIGLLVLGCASNEASPQTPVTASTARSDVGEVRQSLLASEPTRPESNRTSHAALATTAGEAAEQWEHFRLPGVPPDLDYTVDAMLFVAGGESTGCPIEPTGLEIDVDTGWVMALVRPYEDECPSDDRPRTLVYRVRAADLPPAPFEAGIQGHGLLPVS